MSDRLQSLLAARPWLLADGATGTNYFDAGLETGDAPELWNFDHPERVAALQAEVGAQPVATEEVVGLDVDIMTSDMSNWFSARFYAETVAWAKVLIEKGTRRIIGAHLVGHHGEELIHLFALAMRHGISADQLGDEMYAFPTFAADIKSML